MTAINLAVLDQLHPVIVSAIRAGLPPGWTVRFATGRTEAEQVEVLEDADAVLIVGAPFPAALVRVAGRLKVIQKVGSGVDTIDLEACAARGIAVGRLQGGNALAVAEHTVMMMLAALRRMPQIDRRTRDGEWVKEEGRGTHRHLSGKRVGLVGFGAIGRAVSRVLTGFGTETVFYDPVPPPEDSAHQWPARLVCHDELIATSDIVSLHLPLLPETRNLIDAEAISNMKPGAVFVNAARGGLVDEAALKKALESGHLFAAALDVFAREPAAGNPLFMLDNVVVTPHLAGATLDNFDYVLKRGIDNLQQFFAGQGLPAEDRVA